MNHKLIVHKDGQQDKIGFHGYEQTKEEIFNLIPGIVKKHFGKLAKSKADWGGNGEPQCFGWYVNNPRSGRNGYIRWEQRASIEEP